MEPRVCIHRGVLVATMHCGLPPTCQQQKGFEHVCMIHQNVIGVLGLDTGIQHLVHCIMMMAYDMAHCVSDGNVADIKSSNYLNHKSTLVERLLTFRLQELVSVKLCKQ